MKRITDYIRNYFRKRKPLSIASDIVFAVLLLLLIIPSTRTEVVAFAKRLTLFSPDTSTSVDYGKLGPIEYQWPLNDMDNTALRIANFSGKIMFINFWGTWCPPCVAEMPSIQKLYDRFRDDDNIAFMMITSEKPEKVKAFMRDKGYDFPVYFNLFKTPGKLDFTKLPTTLIIAPDGRIVLREEGAADWNADSVHELLKSLE